MVIYLQMIHLLFIYKMRLKLVCSPQHGKVIQVFHNVCVVPIELTYTASTSHAPTTVATVDPIKYIVPI